MISPSARQLLITAAIAAASAAAYHRAVTTNDFAWDDGYIVLDNPAIRDLANVPGMFAAPWASGVGYALGDAQNRPYYRPLPLASMAVDWAVAGPDPAVFHATNIATHVLASLLLLAWLRRLLPQDSWKPAALAALLFAVHPVHTEAVNVVSYRTTLLSGLFVFGSLAALIAPATPARVVAGVAAFVMGLLSKETALVTPGLLLVQDLWLGTLTRRRLVAVYLPLAVAAAAWLAVRAGMTAPAYYSWFDGLTPWQSALMVPRIFFLYVRLAVLPWPLCPFYDWSILGAPASPLEPDVLAGSLLLASAVVGAVLLRRRVPLASLGLAWFLLALLPVSHIVPFFDAAGERFLYVPLAGLVLAAAGAAAAMPASSRTTSGAAVTAALVIALAFGSLTAARTAEWRDSETILRATTRDFPSSVSAHIGLGRLLLGAGRPAEAVPELEEVTRLAPRLSVGHGLLAAAQARAGDLAASRSTLRAAPLPERGLPSAAQIARSELLAAGDLAALRDLGL